jgi:hypothetical protein
MNLSTFSWNSVFITMSKTRPHWSQFWAIWKKNVQTIPPYLRTILILFWVLYLFLCSGFATKVCTNFLS